MSNEELTKLVLELKQEIAHLKDARTIDINTQRAFQGRGFLRASRPIDDLTPRVGRTTLYVATISGGTLDHRIDFSDGILTIPQ